MLDINAIVQTIAILALPLVFAITLHEAAHGYAARHFGDPTAWLAGRISLNPLRHIDPVGTILIPAAILLFSGGSFLFGYAKPVPVDFSRLRNPKQDMFWVAAAGPGANLFMALCWAALLKLAWIMPGNEFTLPLSEMSKIGIIVNQSVAGVGMQREQILAAGLGVPVVGVIPLATKDVLTATNLHRMQTLLDHPLIGPAYNELARTCLPGRGLAEFEAQAPRDTSSGMAGSVSGAAAEAVALPLSLDAESIQEPELELASGSRKKGLFRRV